MKNPLLHQSLQLSALIVTYAMAVEGKTFLYALRTKSYLATTKSWLWFMDLNSISVLLLLSLNRILGGIGVILPWWPIKAYRPCPNFIDKGGFYQRSGQGLDEIAFGRDSTFDKGGN